LAQIFAPSGAHSAHEVEKGGSETGGSADPGDVNQLLREELAE